MQRITTSYTEPVTAAIKSGNTPYFNIEKRKNEYYELNVQGNFSPGWLARLASGLSDHQISILQGNGKLVRASYWEAKFDIKADSNTKNLGNIDYRALIETRNSTSSNESLELINYSIHPPETNSNAVWVEIQGADKIGFLSKVLNIFSFNSLFPCAIEVGTIGTSVHDRFLLRGIAGAPPSSNALNGLKELLDDYIVE